MNITYIGHSGCLIEWETSYWLFDYHRGEIPEMDPAKKVFVFVSHRHKDHYNPNILRLSFHYPDIVFVLSSDIRTAKNDGLKMGIPEKTLDGIIFVKPSEEYELSDADGERIVLKTLKSTDRGVAFLLQYKGKSVYHAGDLNLWVWKEESKQYNNNMTALFQREMEKLKDVPIDIAFAPIDPRQGEWYAKGVEILLNTAAIRYLFPMHFWDKPSLIRQFKQDHTASINHAEVMDISQDGQTWELEI